MVNLVSRTYCKQCERFIHEEEEAHIAANPTHVMVEYTTTEGHADTIANLPGQSSEIPRILNYSYYNMRTDSKNYNTKAYILFPGTDHVGVPSKIEVVAKSSSKYSEAAQIRIYDATNGVVIAESFISASRPTVIDLGAISGASADDAVWELQMKKLKYKIYCYALSVKF